MYLFENNEPKVITEQDKICFKELLNAPIRRLLEQTEEGLYLVQDFYPSGIKRTDPFLVKEKNHTSYYELTSKNSHYKELTIIGDLIVWYECNQKLLTCSFENFKLQGLYNKWDESGKLKKQETYKDDLLNGPRILYYENGAKKTEENWVQGKKHGFIKNWYNNGQLAKEEYWKDGYQEGTSIAYYINGQNSSKAYFERGKLEGINLGWFKNGQIRYETHYKNGKQEGYDTAYYENGQLKFIINYEDDIPGGYVEIYTDDGQLYKEEIDYYWEWGELHNTLNNLNKTPYTRSLLKIVDEEKYLVQDFYDTGEKLTDPYYLICKDEAHKEKFDQINYSSFEKMTGQIIQYNKKGYKIFEGNYIEGKKQGKWLKWYRCIINEAPLLEETIFYENNILKRKITWHKNGNKKQETIYNNEKEEIISSYNDDGSFNQLFLAKLFEKTQFNAICRKVIDVTQNNYHLVQDFYYSGEKVTDPYLIKKPIEVKQICEHQKITSIIGPFTVWYTSMQNKAIAAGIGSVFMSLSILAGISKRKSISKVMAETKEQQMSCKCTFNFKGKLEGLFQVWHPNGKLEKEGYMKHGREFGKWKYWNQDGKKTHERFYFIGIIINEKKFI